MCVQESNQEVTKVISIVKKVANLQVYLFTIKDAFPQTRYIFITLA